jgi:hypothetical protein
MEREKERERERERERRKRGCFGTLYDVALNNGCYQKINISKDFIQTFYQRSNDQISV